MGRVLCPLFAGASNNDLYMLSSNQAEWHVIYDPKLFFWRYIILTR